MKIAEKQLAAKRSLEKINLNFKKVKKNTSEEQQHEHVI